MKDRLEPAQNITFDNIIGKVILIGITRVKDGSVIDQKQFHGTIIYAKENEGISVKQDDGSIYSIPPQLSNIMKAEPGEYRERSTGKVIINPDLVSSWTIEMQS